MKERISLFGVNIDNVTMEETIAEIERLIKLNKNSIIFTPNVHRVVFAKKDEHIKEIYDKADLLLPDGIPLIWASKLLGKPLKERVTGSDLLPLFCQIASKKGYRLFFLGAEPGIAKKAKNTLINKNPGLQIIGTYSPPYGFENDDIEIKKIIKLIKEKRPDVLFIGLGFPKEEKFLWRHKEKLQVPVSIGIGATFDFIVGKLKRAPKWMQRIGMEWFFRLCQEPRRLWKRYLIGNTIFIWLVMKELIKIKILKKKRS
ncbi:MAG: WecB/TagA/CpsF family glycosyltransferase [Candidatus Aminicenantia bacterium]